VREDEHTLGWGGQLCERVGPKILSVHENSVGLPDEPVDEEAGYAPRFGVARMMFYLVNLGHNWRPPQERRQKIEPDVVLAEKMDDVRPPRTDAGKQPLAIRTKLEGDR
jgi:hypothetical protein